MKLRFIYIGPLWAIAVAFAFANASEKQVEEELPENAMIIGGDEQRNIVVSFEGFIRSDGGTINGASLKIWNTTASTNYDLVFDERIKQGVMFLFEGGTNLNDPFPSESRMLGDLSLNLITLAPNKSIKYDVNLEDSINDSNIYTHLETLEKINIQLSFNSPFYNVGSDTATTQRLGIVSASKYFTDVPYRTDNPD